MSLCIKCSVSVSVIKLLSVMVAYKIYRLPLTSVRDIMVVYKFIEHLKYCKGYIMVAYKIL